MDKTVVFIEPHRLWGWLALLCMGLGSAPAEAAGAEAVGAAGAEAVGAAGAARAIPGDSPLTLRFRDFYQSPVGPTGLQMTAALRAAHAQRVRLTGYMVVPEVPMAGHFFLTPLPLTMSAHADGEADDLPPSAVLVQMPALDSLTPLLATPGLLQLTGRLEVGRFEMLDGRVVWLRLLLEPRSGPAL